MTRQAVIKWLEQSGMPREARALASLSRDLIRTAENTNDVSTPADWILARVRMRETPQGYAWWQMCQAQLWHRTKQVFEMEEKAECSHEE